MLTCTHSNDATHSSRYDQVEGRLDPADDADGDGEPDENSIWPPSEEELAPLFGLQPNGEGNGGKGVYEHLEAFTPRKMSAFWHAIVEAIISTWPQDDLMHRGREGE